MHCRTADSGTLGLKKKKNHPIPVENFLLIKKTRILASRSFLSPDRALYCGLQVSKGVQSITNFGGRNGMACKAQTTAIASYCEDLQRSRAPISDRKNLKSVVLPYLNSHVDMIDLSCWSSLPWTR
jgi:hypothetical protein